MAESETRDPEELTPLTGPVFYILLSLADGDRHGYGIMGETRARTGGKLRAGPGTLYRSLAKLLEEGMIEDVGESVDPKTGKTRHYYRLTEFGRRVLLAEFSHREREVEDARATLSRLSALPLRPAESAT